MKKFFVTMSLMSAALVTFAQEGAVESTSFHHVLKDQFIDGGPEFMASIALTFVVGMAFVIERIIYLNLSEVNTKKLLGQIEEALANGDVAGAKEICIKTRGPIASICTQALMRLEDGKSLDEIDKSISSYGGLQAGFLEKNLSWITLFIAAAPSLGFLGTAVGMVQAFNDIVKAGDISATIVASGMKVALITTIGGIIVALILQVFYNYLLSKVESIVSDMEDASISLLDMIIKHKLGK